MELLFIATQLAVLLIPLVSGEVARETCGRLLSELNDTYSGYWELTDSDCSLICGTGDKTRSGKAIVTHTSFIINQGAPCQVNQLTGSSVIRGACNLGECDANHTASPAELSSLPGPGFMAANLELTVLDCEDMARENFSLVFGILEVEHDGFEIFNMICNLPPHPTREEIAACRYKHDHPIHDDSVMALILIDDDTGRTMEREDYDLEQFQAQDHHTTIEMSPTCFVTLDISCSYLYHHQKHKVTAL